MSVPLPGPAITTLKILVSLIKELCLATSCRELAGSLVERQDCLAQTGRISSTVTPLPFPSVAGMGLLREEGGMSETSLALLLAQLR